MLVEALAACSLRDTSPGASCCLPVFGHGHGWERKSSQCGQSKRLHTVLIHNTCVEPTNRTSSIKGSTQGPKGKRRIPPDPCSDDTVFSPVGIAGNAPLSLADGAIHSQALGSVAAVTKQPRAPAPETRTIGWLQVSRVRFGRGGLQRRAGGGAAALDYSRGAVWVAGCCNIIKIAYRGCACAFFPFDSIRFASVNQIKQSQNDRLTTALPLLPPPRTTPRRQATARLLHFVGAKHHHPPLSQEDGIDNPCSLLLAAAAVPSYTSALRHIAA